MFQCGHCVILSFNFNFCRYDVPGIIPDGSIQRAGENVLAVVTELANSPFLVDPGKDKHGKVTYFDFLGLFMVVYPERLGTILNCATVIFSLLSMWLHCREGKAHNYEFEFVNFYFFLYYTEIWLVFQSSLVVLISQLVGIVLSLVTGVVVMLFGKSMSWFANPFVIVPLFYLPTLLGQVIVQWWWGRKVRYIDVCYVLLSYQNIIELFIDLIKTNLHIVTFCSPFVDYSTVDYNILATVLLFCSYALVFAIDSFLFLTLISPSLFLFSCSPVR